MNAPTMSPSPELLQANQRLHELRQQTQVNRAAPGQLEEPRPSAHTPPWAATGQDDTQTTAVTPLAHLPAHLGWGSQPASQAIRRALPHHEQLRADHPASRPIADGSDAGGQPLGVYGPTGAGTQLRLPLHGDTIRHYPSLGIAALQAERVAHYRVWLLCRYLDRRGQGWLPVSDVRQQLTGKESKLRLFGWRRLRQVLGQGHGRFWQWDKASERLWLYGAAVVAANLEVARLAGRVVALPLAAVTAGIGDCKAHLYAAWHSGRRQSNPISRQVQQTLTGIPERTQRHYGRVAHIGVQSNIAIGGKYTPEEGQKQAWQRGHATFTFTDHQGRQGRKGSRYLAWHLPNSYRGPHMQTAVGRMRKINQKLKDLVHTGAQGNGSRKVEKLYYANGAEAGRALNRGQSTETYWPMVVLSKEHKLWAVFSLG